MCMKGRLIDSLLRGLIEGEKDSIVLEKGARGKQSERVGCILS